MCLLMLLNILCLGLHFVIVTYVWPEEHRSVVSTVTPSTDILFSCVLGLLILFSVAVGLSCSLL